MALPPELLEEIIRLYANSTSSPSHRRQRLFRLCPVSRIFRDLAEHELLRNAFIDGAQSLKWLGSRIEEGRVQTVDAVSVSFRAGEGMLDRGDVLALLAKLPRMARLSIVYQPRRFLWERLQVKEEGLEKVAWSNLTHLTLSNISLDFFATIPTFSSLTHLSLTGSRFSLPAPHPRGALLPPSSLPSLRFLSLRDSPKVDYRQRERALGPSPIYHPRHLIPLAPQLNALVLDYRLSRALRLSPDYRELFGALQKVGTPVLWEFREAPDEKEALSVLRAFHNDTFGIQHFRIASSGFLKAFKQLFETIEELETVSFAPLLSPEDVEAVEARLAQDNATVLVERVDDGGEAEREPEEFLRWCNEERALEG
ncbi:hypothetical protein JCM6882_005927 [Rhodosporidiobolus microsporus]